MAAYSYKRVIYHALPGAWREQWEKSFKEEAGREPDGDPGYDGDNWHMAADYIESLHAERDRWRKLEEDQSLAKSTAVQRVAELERELAEARAGHEKLSDALVKADGDFVELQSRAKTPHEQAVLDAARDLSLATLGLLRGDEWDTSPEERAFAKAELARREATK